MDLMSKSVEIYPSYFEEEVQKLVWVDSMVEEYESIIKNIAWEVVPRLEGKSVVESIWIYKAKQAADGSVEKYKAIFVAIGFSQVEKIPRAINWLHGYLERRCRYRAIIV